MTEQAEQNHLQFASEVAELAVSKGYDFNAILNGLAIVSASFLVDYAADDNANINEDVLEDAVMDFVLLMSQARTYAAMRLDRIAAERAAQG